MDPIYDTENSSDDEVFNYLAATDILPELSTSSNSSQPHKRRKPNKGRNFRAAFQRINWDYFIPNCKYSEQDFERRFRLRRVAFNRINSAVKGKGIFVQRVDRFGKPGIRPLQRVTAALQMLANGIAADALDEYLEMSEDSVLLSLKEFCKHIVQLFKNEYLRAPSRQHLRRIMCINKQRGFSGCIGPIDCQHWA